MVLGTTGGLPAKHGMTDELGEVSYGLLFFFLRYSTQDWPARAKGEGRTVCVFVGIVRDIGILMKILSHYS